MLRKTVLASFVATIISITSFSSAQAATFGTYGDAFNNGTAFDLTSNQSTGSYSGLYFMPTANTLTAGGITQLSSDYNMLTGTFTGGAPRFTLFDDSFQSAYVYWGTPTGGGSFSNPNSNGTPGNTGNYADLTSADVRVYSNGFGGVNDPNTGLTWSQFVALTGLTDVSYVFLDLDAGFAGDQHLLVNNFTVNDNVFAAEASATPLPAALPLFASGVGVIGFVLRRAKRKTRASA